jgi:hypothetical protein
VILIPGERRQRECTSGPRAGQKEVKVQYDVVGTRAQLDFRTNESVRCYLHFPHRGGEELRSPAAIVSLDAAPFGTGFGCISTGERREERLPPADGLYPGC